MVLGVSVPLSLLRNLLEILQLCFLFLILDRPKYSWKKTIFFYTIFIIFHTIVGTIWVTMDIESYSRLCTASIILQSFLFFYLLSQYHLYQVIYNICLQTFVLIFGIYLCVKFSQTFCKGNPWADLLFRVIYFILVAYFYRCILRTPYRELADNYKIRWKTLAFIGFIGDILIVYCGIYPSHVMVRSVREQIIFIGINTVFFATHIVMLQMMFIMLKESTIKEELKYSAMNNAYLEKQLAEIQKNIWVSKRIRHDSRHHNIIISEYAKKGDISGLLNYIHQQEQEIENNRLVIYCENKTLNSIFTVYAERAAMSDIEMCIKANVGNNIRIKDIHLTAILGNLLDNALHSCQRSNCANAKINVSMHIKSGKLAIIVENTCNEEVYFEEGIPKSKYKEGIGIQSILRSVNIYHGEIDFKYKNHIFLCRILIGI